MKPRVAVVTAGHLSTCPRMLKAADALHAAGYQVRVVSTNHTAWASATDLEVAKQRGWTWRAVDLDRQTARTTQMLTGLRFRVAESVARLAGASRVPAACAIRAYSRVHDELVRVIVHEPTDFVYGGTTGALAAVAASARRMGVPYGIDLEDFHSGEQSGEDSDLVHALAERVEVFALERAAFVTTSSPMIAQAYAQKYGIRPITIHNTFSIDFPTSDEGAAGQPLPIAGQPLRLYWFSQTLGPGRGLEDVVRALGRTGRSAELHLRAKPISSYLAGLRRLQQEVAPALSIVLHAPAAPDDMVRLAQGYDAGLSCEQTDVLNRRLCLTNKIFTSLAAGAPVVVSRTPAQATLAGELGEAAFSYGCGDVDGLAGVFGRLAGDGDLRCRAARAARAAAQRRWHWEHEADRGALLAASADAVA